MCTECNVRVLLCCKCVFTDGVHKAHRDQVLVWDDFVRDTVNMSKTAVVRFVLLSKFVDL